MTGSYPEPDTPQTDLKRRKTGEKPGGFAFLRDIAPRKRWLPIGILLAGLITTLLISLYIKAEVETAAKNEFGFICNEIQLNIADRLASHALVLYSSAALFDASTFVSREEWRVFTSALRIEQQMPGTQGIGFTLLIPPERLEQHIQDIRQEGFPDYTIRPEGKREIYSAIIYLEPFSGRNLRAFGYDMFSEPVRRAAMERARDENTAALTGKVTLVQETGEDVQAGALMYVPVYRPGMPHTTVAERRAAILGWVYSPYRMNDLMSGTLRNYERMQGDRQITLEIYDGETISDEALLYSSQRGAERTPAGIFADYSKITRVSFFGHLWTLKFTHLGGVASTADYDSFWLVLLGGTSFSLLLSGLTISSLRTAHYLESIRQLAEQDALTGVYNRRKILELAEEEYVRAKRYRHQFVILMIDLNGFKQINDTFGHIVGDQALRLTANAIQNTLRQEIDQIGRFGGDEFILILPETRLSEVEQITTRIRDNVAHETQAIVEGLSPVTLSIGAAEVNETTQSLDAVIEQADKAMYADKERAKELAAAKGLAAAKERAAS